MLLVPKPFGAESEEEELLLCSRRWTQATDHRDPCPVNIFSVKQSETINHHEGSSGLWVILKLLQTILINIKPYAYSPLGNSVLPTLDSLLRVCNKPEPVQHCKCFHNESALWCQAPCKEPAAPELGRPPWQAQLISAALWCAKPGATDFYRILCPFSASGKLFGRCTLCLSITTWYVDITSPVVLATWLNDTSISLELTVVLATWLNLYVDIISAHCRSGHMTYNVPSFLFKSLCSSCMEACPARCLRHSCCPLFSLTVSPLRPFSFPLPFPSPTLSPFTPSLPHSPLSHILHSPFLSACPPSLWINCHNRKNVFLAVSWRRRKIPAVFFEDLRLGLSG